MAFILEVKRKKSVVEANAHVRPAQRQPRHDAQLRRFRFQPLVLIDYRSFDVRDPNLIAHIETYRFPYRALRETNKAAADLR